MKKIILYFLVTLIFVFFIFTRSDILWGDLVELYRYFFYYGQGWDIVVRAFTQPHLYTFVILFFSLIGPVIFLGTFIFGGKYLRIYMTVLTILFCLFLLPAVRYTGIGKEYVTERIFSGMLARGVEYTIINTGEILKLTDYDIDASWGIGEFSTFNPIFCGKERCYNTIHRKTPFLELFPHASFPRDPRREWVQYLGDWTEYLLILGSR